jgi:predicted TPR repeat methyltransferase
MKSPLEDTIWGASYGSIAAIEAAFDRFGPEYHEAILATGAPAGAATAILPFLAPTAQGIDLGCGSGVLGLALRDKGHGIPLDGIDLSPGMLKIAASTGCYRTLLRANLLLPLATAALAPPYDFAITMGLIGDYVPYYLALPQLVSLLKPDGVAAFAVESRSTPWRPLEKLAGELGLVIQSETVLPVPEAKLASQEYHFYVARLYSSASRAESAS